MLCRCYRLILLCWLACCSQGATAVETLLDRSALAPSGQQWLFTHDELVVGMEQEAIRLVEVVQGDRDVDMGEDKA